jgi:TrmH family RNA methyltransferase
VAVITKTELKHFASLSLKKHRELLDLFLVEGTRSVGEACSAGAPVELVIYTHVFADSTAGSSLLSELGRRGIRCESVSGRELASLADTVHAQGIVAVVRRWSSVPADLLVPGEWASLAVALDAVADPGNLGAIIRTCDWFGVDAVLLGRECVDLYNPKVVRSTMGSLFHLRIAEGADLPASVRTARERGYTVAIADPSASTALNGGNLPPRLLLVFGNEARGVSAEIEAAADLRLAIPRFGRAESLNVAVACGVFLSAFRLGEE